MSLKIRESLIFFFLFVCYFVHGQDFFANIRTIGTEDGLSHYKIHCFYPEKAGMWIGATGGLNFYDGYNWKYWTKEASQLNIETVNYIYKDQEGLLWLFAAESINRHKNIKAIDILNQDRDAVLSFEQKFGTKAPFELKEVNHFFEDQQQRLYCFANNQLWRYSSAEHFQLISLPPDFKPYSIFSDGTYAGKLLGNLALVSKDGNLIYPSSYPLGKEYIRILGTSDKFWVSHLDVPISGFEKLADGTYKAVKYPILNKQDRISQPLYFDEQQNQLWVRKGTHTYLLDNNEQLLYKYKIIPRLIAKDYNGNVWMPRNKINIFQLQKKKFNRYLNRSSERHTVSRCRGMVEKDGKLYVNTYDGLRIVDLATKGILAPFEKPNRTFVALKKRDGQILIANRKVFQVGESNPPTPLLKEGENIQNRSWALFEDTNGRIWSGHKGLSYLENGSVKEFEKYNEFEALKRAVVLFFFKDKNEKIWVGSDKGLFQLDLEKGIIAAYGKNRRSAFQLPSSKFQHMHQDAQGVFWLATEDAGLIRWNKANGNIQSFGKNEGMLSNNIYGVYEDDYGYLWMSSFNGLIRFQKESKSITVYNEEDGISESEFNRISHYQSEDGHIYFGGQNGVTGFHPKYFQEEKSKQEAFELNIKQVSVFGKEALKDTLSNGSKIDLMDLSPGARIIDFEITSNDLFWNDNFKLHYNLESLSGSQKVGPVIEDKISSTNHIQLFDMHPGHYNLQIKAILSNGKQLGETMNIPIKIVVPVFHRPVFWVLVFFAMTIAIWGFIKLRTTHLQKRQIELEEMVTERTQQILKDQKVIQTQAKQIEVMKDQLNRKDERWLEQFQDMINQRLEDPDLYLPDIIEDMEISRSTFYEKVKTLTQMTPNQYIQEVRLNKAKAILDEGRVKTVKEVAYAIGMKRPSYFSKLFKERFGIMPSAYFRNHSN